MTTLALTEWTVRMGQGTWMMFHTEKEARAYIRGCPHISSFLYQWNGAKWERR